jgi:hypothetical protein
LKFFSFVVVSLLLCVLLNLNVDVILIMVANKKRVADLPKKVRDLKDCYEDLAKFLLAKEIDSKKSSMLYGEAVPLVVAVKYVDDDGKLGRFELSNLSLDHHQRLVYNMGIVTCGAASKFYCRQELGHKITYDHNYKDNGMSMPLSLAPKINNSIFRAVNIIFHDKFFPTLLVLNDNKNRDDQMAKDTHIAFWNQVRAVYNTAVNYVRKKSLGVPAPTPCVMK